MRTSSIFWGVFFIFIGFFILMQKLDAWDIDFSYYMDYWPIIIILWGISILKLPDIIKKVLAALSAIFLAVLIMAFINHSWCPFFDFNDHSETTYDEQIHKRYNDVVNIPYSENYKFASLELNAGACSINFKDTTSQLIETYSGLPTINLDYSIKEIESTVTVLLDLKFGHKFFKKKFKNDVWVKLNTQPVWDLDFDIGAVDMDCDFSKYKIKDFCVDVGAANVDIKLGDLYESTYLEIDAGASDITVKIPKESGCKIEASTGLSNEDFNGFLKTNGTYYTNEFEKAKSKIIIKISGGVSDFEVIKY